MLIQAACDCERTRTRTLRVVNASLVILLSLRPSVSNIRAWDAGDEFLCVLGCFGGEMDKGNKMKRSTSIFRTQKGERYLGQLCKHFAHKIDAVAEGDKGYVRFDFGTASLSSDPDALHMAVEAQDDEMLTRIKGVMESHLVRFAFREELEGLDWQDFTIDA